VGSPSALSKTRMVAEVGGNLLKSAHLNDRHEGPPKKQGEDGYDMIKIRLEMLGPARHTSSGPWKTLRFEPYSLVLIG